MGECLYFLVDNTILTIAPFDTYLAIVSTECDPDEIITSKLDRDYIDE